MFININDTPLFYTNIGEGPDIVMLHGWKHDNSTWWGIVDALKNDFKLHLIDLPGFGKSEMNKSFFDVSDYVEVVLEYINLQKLKKPIILGHSLGGRIAIKMLAQNPNLGSKLILEDAAGIKPKQDGLKPLLYLGAKAFKLLVPNLFGFKQAIRKRFYGSLESDYIDAGELTKTLTKLLDEDLTKYLTEIKTETLIIWGENDRAVPLSDGKMMYRKIEKSRIETIDCGHSPHLESPEQFIYWVRNFLL